MRHSVQFQAHIGGILIPTCACAVRKRGMMNTAVRGGGGNGVLCRFFALFCTCYVLGVIFLHYSVTTAGGNKNEVSKDSGA